jgi:acyl-CoA thioesterase
VRTGEDAAPTVRWPGADWPTPADLAAVRGYELTVDQLLCAEGDMIFGGFSMALIAEAAQGWTGGRVQALTANFLSPVMTGDRLVLEPRALRLGRRVRQLQVDARVAGRLVLSSAVVLGGPQDGESRGPRAGRRLGGAAPHVPPPERCPQRSYRFRQPGSFIDVIDARLASPEPEPGTGSAGVLLWARLDAHFSDAARLVALSDHLPYLVVRALGGVRHATTVAASVRLLSGRPAGWTLLDIRLTDLAGEFCTGQVRMWSPDGEPLAVASQSTYVVMAD